MVALTGFCFFPPFLIILHILYSIYERSKAEMPKFEHFLGFE